MFDLPEDPRMAERRASHHYSIDAEPVERVFGFLRGIYVAVTYYRYMHPGVVLHGSYQCPVRLALVHLTSCPAVYGQCLDSHILQSFSEFHDYLGILVPAEPCLYGHRFADSIDNTLGYHHHLVRFPHHSGTRSPAGDFADGTAEVYVNDRVALAKWHLSLSVRQKGPVTGVLEMRRHLSCYFKGLPDFRDTRVKLVTEPSADELVKILDYVGEKWGGCSLEESASVYGL